MNRLELATLVNEYCNHRDPVGYAATFRRLYPGDQATADRRFAVLRALGWVAGRTWAKGEATQAAVEAIAACPECLQDRRWAAARYEERLATIGEYERCYLCMGLFDNAGSKARGLCPRCYERLCQQFPDADPSDCSQLLRRMFMLGCKWDSWPLEVA